MKMTILVKDIEEMTIIMMIFKDPVRNCQYRNCQKDISNTRKNSKYCCRRHKEIEYVYRKRKLKRESK